MPPSISDAKVQRDEQQKSPLVQVTFFSDFSNLFKGVIGMLDNITKSILAVFIFVSASFAQGVYNVGGRVTDSKSGEPIAAANVRVAGSARGTITNLDGSYLLSLPAGDYTLVFSYVGYRTDSLRVTLNSNISRNVKLEPAEILMPEVVSIAEDPAYAIIRRAIARKHEWSKLLHSYEFKAFTRQMFYRDTSIAAITESYTDGFWRQGDTLCEVVSQKRETKNLPEMLMTASVGEIVNFTDDIIDIIGYKFVGPIAEDALDHYKYRLIRTFRKDGVTVYDIEIIPDSRIVPLFAGQISIADSSYAVVGIDVKPNEALNIPFVSNLKLNFTQRYSLYDEKFWMPTDIIADMGGKVSLVGLNFPNIVFDQTSVIYDYRINSEIPDSIFKKSKRQLVVDSNATRYDSTFWSSHEVLPLTAVEQKAYKTLDSTQTLQKQFKPTGATASILGSGSSLSFVKYLDIRYDRVEGLFLGGTYTYTSGKRNVSITIGNEGASTSIYSTGWRVNAAAGYGISDRIFKWHLGVVYPLIKMNKLELGADVYRDIAHFPDGDFYPSIMTSVFSLFGRNDYQDYYMTYGWKAFLNTQPFNSFTASISYLSEQERTAFQHTNFNIMTFGHIYRANPAIDDGQMRSMQFDVRYGEQKTLLGLVSANAIELSAEYSSPSITGSEFNFSRYYLTASYHFSTFLRSYLFPPQLQVSFAGGTSTGTLPPQREFVLDSQLGRFETFGVLRSAYPREFVGDRFIMVSVEHNFRNVPFLMLDIPFLYRSGMEVLVDGAAAQSWMNGLSTTNGWYYEAGIGIGKIFGLIRADLTYRLSRPRDLFFTVGLSSIL